MKKIPVFLSALSALATAVACNKTTEGSDSVSLTASTTQASVGQPVSFTLTAAANASSWSVTPSANVSKAYGITTSKTNEITFNQAGTYTVGVRVRNINSLSATASLDSVWHKSGASKGTCVKGQDSASLTIVVTK